MADIEQQMAAFDAAMVAAGYDKPERSQFPEGRYLWQRDADRFVGFQLAALAPQGEQVADSPKCRNCDGTGEYCLAGHSAHPNNWHRCETCNGSGLAALASQPLNELSGNSGQLHPAPAAVVPAALYIGQRAEWEDSIGRWWPVRITGSHPATYDARLDDAADAIGFDAARFRVAAPAPEGGSHG
jgi:hypothetical protein